MASKKKKRELVGIVKFNGEIEENVNKTANNNKNKKKSIPIVGSINSDGTITKYNTETVAKNHAQQYNLDGSKKIAPTISITTNNIDKRGATNLIRGSLQQDIKNKTFQAATEQNKQQINLAGDSTLSKTGKQKLREETAEKKKQANVNLPQMVSADSIKNKSDDLVKDLSKKTGYSEQEVTDFINDYNNGRWDSTKPKYRNASYKFKEAGTEVYVIAKEYDKYKPTLNKQLSPLENAAQSSTNALIETGKGIVDFSEGVLDAGVQLGSSKYNPMMWITTGQTPWSKDQSKLDSYQDIAKEIVSKDASQNFIDNELGYGKKLSNGKTIQETLDEGALIKSDNLGGQVFRNIGAQLPGLMTGTEAGSLATMGISSFGSGVEQAYNQGATRGEATGYGLLNSSIEVATEKMFSGVGGVLGKGELDDAIINGINKNIKNELAQKLTSFGIKSLGEGTEEVLGDLLQPMAQKLTYASEEELTKLYKEQNYLEDFVSGVLSAAIMQGSTMPINNQNQIQIKNQVKEIINKDNANQIFNDIVKNNKNLSEWEVANIVNNALKETNQKPVDFSKNIVQDETPQETNSNAPQISQEIGQNQELSNETTNTSQTIETPKNNIKSYTENDINRFSTGNNLIDGVNSDLKSFTEKFYDKETKSAKKKKAPVKSQKMFLGRISDALSTKINLLLNNSGRFSQKYETKDTNIVISSDNIEHIYNHHGNEKMPGQIDVTPENLSKYVDVVSNPDYIGLSSQLSRGNTPTLYFTKKINGYSVAVEVLSTKKQLYPQSYYVFDSNSKEYTDFIKNNKLKKAWDVESGDFKSSDINVQDDTSAAFTDNNVTTKTQKSQVAPVSSQYSMQQNTKIDTETPIIRENNEINERIEKDDTPNVITYKVSDKITRKQVRQQLLDEMDITAEELSIGDDINPINFQLTDPIRVNEKVFGRELGKKINEGTIQKTKHNTAEKTRWLNLERNDIKQLGIKPRSKESAAVQKYGEKQYVNKYGETVSYGDIELANEFSNTETQEKIKRAAEVIRNKYDKYIDQINEVITALGYDEIPKRTDYMRHFQELGDIFSQTGVPFNLNDMKAEDLPTDINGLTEFNKPGKNWFASAQQRTGNKTTYDAITGIDGYLEGAGNLIYHTADIQRYRALSTLIRDSFGQTKGFENLDNLTNEQATQRIKDIQNNKFSRYAAWLDEQANSLAGKKGAIDRGVERAIGRRGYTFLNTLKKQVGSNMTGYNVRSALTNLISSTIASAKTNKIALTKGTISTIHNMFKNDGFINKSDFLTSRFGSDSLSPKLWQKLSNAGQIFMTGTDYFTSNLIVRSKYYEGLQKGMTESEAIEYADDFGARVMGDRSQGSTAEAFNSKTLGLLTQFQLEVNNQWQYMMHDTKMDYQKNSEINGGLKAGASALFQMGQLAIYSYLFNELFETLTGSRAAFDPIEILKSLFDADEDESLDERIAKAGELLVDNIPFGNLITGGGRIPIAEAFKGSATLLKKLTNQKNTYGGDITWKDVGNDVLETLPYYVLPTGYSQAKKTIKGLSMFSKDKEVTGSYTKSGNLRFPVENTTKNKIQAGLFGEYASENAREYFDGKNTALKENQQEIYKTLNVPISDYWELDKEIKNIKKILKGKPTEERKKALFNYIESLDINAEQKEILKKLQYKSYKESDNEIKEYINSSKVSKETKKSMLEKLGLDK